MAAAALLGAAVVSAATAHADDDADYIGQLKRSGLFPSPGVSRAKWEADMINAGHSVCQMIAAGYTRDGIKAREGAKNPGSKHNAQVVVDAAVAIYCPEYW